MGKTLGVIQSNYIPWKGYFDFIAAVDEFILYDDVQYTKNDWRNRNRIKTELGLRWLTIPIDTSGRFGQLIRDTQTADNHWRRKHWLTLEQTYQRTTCFADYREVLRDHYLDSGERSLSVINRGLIELICSWLRITTPIRWSMDLEPQGDRVERLIDLCLKTGSTHYLSGPAARCYLAEREQEFHQSGITVGYMEYSGYPDYPQLHPPFDHYVTVLDLLFNTGEQAREHMLLSRAGRAGRGTVSSLGATDGTGAA